MCPPLVGTMALLTIYAPLCFFLRLRCGDPGRHIHTVARRGGLSNTRGPRRHAQTVAIGLNHRTSSGLTPKGSVYGAAGSIRSCQVFKVARSRKAPRPDTVRFHLPDPGSHGASCHEDPDMRAQYRGFVTYSRILDIHTKFSTLVSQLCVSHSCTVFLVTAKLRVLES